VKKDLSGTKTNPREETIHSLMVRAFSIVSAVVKVFDTTTTAKLLDKKYKKSSADIHQSGTKNEY
jgi:DNA recombination-dependent growth factor C